jgi:transposase
VVPAEAGAKSPPTRCRRHRDLAGHNLSRSGKKGADAGQTSVFIDEAGFQLLPAVERTYAPVGQPPVLVEEATHDHLSVISAVTAAGQLLTQTQEAAFHGEDVVGFLEHLERHLGGQLLIYWDRAPIHRSRPVKEWLAAGHAGRVHIEPLPAYAPDLNPDEGVWDELKRKDLANVSCLNLGQLRRHLRRGTQRLQHRPDLIRSFYAEAGYR